jgi:hypothetical protein
MHGKDDVRAGGEKFVVGNGQIPRDVVGANNLHFTVVPSSDMNGHMVMLVVIFKAKKLPHSWCLGIDVFSEIDESNFEDNFGCGKQYPGLQLCCKDETKIPVCIAASKKALMASNVLVKVYKQMDDLGITKRSVDKNGQSYYPCVIIDGHTGQRFSHLC